MSDKPINESRRGAIKAMIGGLAAVPLMNLVGMAAARAEDLPKGGEKKVGEKKDPTAQAKDLPSDAVDEKSDLAVQMKYKHDATASERKMLTPPGSKPPAEQRSCANCGLYMAQGDGKWGTCSALGNKLVSAKGWCLAWNPKSGA